MAITETHNVSGLITLGSGNNTVGTVNLGTAGVSGHILGSVTIVDGYGGGALVGVNPSGQIPTEAFGFVLNSGSAGQGWEELIEPNSGVHAMQTSFVNLSGIAVYNRVFTGGSGILIPVDAIGTGASGGVALASCGPIINATIRSYSGNGPMRIGGSTASNYPATGKGIELFTQETLTLQVTNTNQISVWNASGFSGQGLSVITTAGQ